MLNPRIDVCVITYNHQNYIEKCLTSIFEQSIQDNMRVIVIDDHSTDKTREILQSLHKKHEFKLILNPENKGIIYSANQLKKEATSEYFTWLDGDDYWTYPDKLKLQIRFLDEHPEYAGCFHDAEILHEKQFDKDIAYRSQHMNKYYSQFNHYKKDIFPEDIIHRLIIPTASLVLRNKQTTDFWGKIQSAHSLAWITHLQFIKHSKFYYFNERWSVYRDHKNGHSKKQKLSDFKLHHINYLKSCLNDTYFKDYKLHIYNSIADEYHNILHAAKRENISKQDYQRFLKAYKTYRKLALSEEMTYFKHQFK